MAPSRISHEDPTIINANTRNIAALAAKKRNQANINVTEPKFAQRALYRPQGGIDDNDFDDFGSVLTPSRLAHHNHIMGDGFLGVGGGDDAAERISLLTDNSLPPIRTIGGVGSQRIREQEEARRRNVRYVVANNNSGGYLEVGASFISQSGCCDWWVCLG